MISRYDLKQRVAVFGFGAKLAGHHAPSHCFPLDPDVWVKGVTVRHLHSLLCATHPVFVRSHTASGCHVLPSFLHTLCLPAVRVSQSPFFINTVPEESILY